MLNISIQENSAASLSNIFQCLIVSRMDIFFLHLDMISCKETYSNSPLSCVPQWRTIQLLGDEELLVSQNRFFHPVCKRLIYTQRQGIWFIYSSALHRKMCLVANSQSQHHDYQHFFMLADKGYCSLVATSYIVFHINYSINNSTG